MRTDDVDAENLAVFARRPQPSQSRRGWPRIEALLLPTNGNLPILTLKPCGLGLRFGQADAADAGLGVGGAGNAVLVDRDERLAGDVVDRDHAFHRRDVRQLRRAGDDVADGVDARLARLLKLVDFDEAAIEFDLVFSRPILSVFGLRPTATSSLSNSHLLVLPLASVTVSCTPLPCARMFSALAPVSQRMPCFLKQRSSSFETSSSSTGTRRGSISRIVTLVPKRWKIDANSTPTAPAPMMASVFGTLGQVQNLNVGENELGIGFQAGEHARFRAGGDNDVLGFDGLRRLRRTGLRTCRRP